MSKTEQQRARDLIETIRMMPHHLQAHDIQTLREIERLLALGIMRDDLRQLAQAPRVEG